MLETGIGKANCYALKMSKKAYAGSQKSPYAILYWENFYEQSSRNVASYFLQLTTDTLGSIDIEMR